MIAGIYARVSTAEQEVKNQLLEIREFCKKVNYNIYKEYVDEAQSGSKVDRPALNEMLEDAFKRKFNVLVVWKLDRLGRSLKHLIEILDELKNKNVDFISVSQNIDTTTPAGRFYFQLLGAVAEFERELIKERVMLGLKRARIEGKKLGRPMKKENLSRTTLWRRKKAVSKTLKNIDTKNDIKPEFCGSVVTRCHSFKNTR